MTLVNGEYGVTSEFQWHGEYDMLIEQIADTNMVEWVSVNLSPFLVERLSHCPPAQNEMFCGIYSSTSSATQNLLQYIKDAESQSQPPAPAPAAPAPESLFVPLTESNPPKVINTGGPLPPDTPPPPSLSPPYLVSPLVTLDLRPRPRWVW
ncbi:hypothetical protein FS749_002528 [Ceratobasidium sp. UAMH 11750]|nr:hypothetical protein FS749_002518 [Ceratobasidium sp. UAMH 11750]KAG9098945.1 hypothetical protein FS749_002528 [Ceratobasidium sp. UAMH 11750]